MKKLLAILLAALFVMTFAACGDNEDAKTRDDAAATEKATEKVEATVAQVDEPTTSVELTEAPTEPKEEETEKPQTGSSKKYATLQEYYDDPVNTKGIDEIKKSNEGVMKIDVRVEGSVLVYDFTYLTTIDSSALPSVKQTMDQALDSTASTFESLAQIMQNDIDESVSLLVIYRNGDGAVITERTFYP